MVVTYGFVGTVLCAYVSVSVSVYWEELLEHMKDDDANPIPPLIGEDTSEWE
jgi:hypothetical protein